MNPLDFHLKNKGKIKIALTEPITKENLPFAYTPGVALVSLAISNDKKLVNDYTWKNRVVAVITDGSAILGIGNLGPEAAFPVMEGKAALFKQFADIDAVPICLNTQNTEEIIQTIKNISPSFGGINLEDIAAPRCFEIERRLREELSIPVMHDDQHGTAVVVLAGLLNALKIRNSKIENIKVVLSGAGAAGTAITKLLIVAGVKYISIVDSGGILSSVRDDINDEKKKLLQEIGEPWAKGELIDIIDGADVFIGVSKPGVLTKDMIRTMAKDPIIFALANPIPEIFPEEAIDAGALIVSTGRSDFPNQINNVLAFPGIFKGALENKLTQFTDEHFLKVAHALSSLVDNPSRENILPGVFDERIVNAVSSVFKDEK